jgi:hypothetical protein
VNRQPPTDLALRMLSGQCIGCGTRLGDATQITEEPERESIKIELDCTACLAHEMVRLTYTDCAEIPGFDLTLVAHLAKASRAD